jgi:hypothetical protein
MRDDGVSNWRPTADHGGSQLRKHWRISYLTVLAVSGSLWLGAIIWFAMRLFGG